MHLNTTSANRFDAIVVGSGISGGWAAKELCESGLKVLLLERGKDLRHPIYPDVSDKADAVLTPEDKDAYYVQSRHYSFKADTKHWFINDKENPYTEVKRYDWVRADVVGGRSLFWSRRSFRWSNLDFAANSREGIAVDWPIRYADLEPWYSHVERFIGVAGNADHLPQIPDGHFMPPWEMNCAEKHFRDGAHASYPYRQVIISRIANLTRPLQGRAACATHGMCNKGCSRGAYFSSNSSTLPTAFATGNLTLRPSSVVSRVIYDEQLGRATGVEIIDTETLQSTEYFSRVIFLNASTVATAAILLNSTSSRFPNGLGNDSNQVGRNLMDHHKCRGLHGIMPGFEDQLYRASDPGGLYIPRFQNMVRNTRNYVRGFNYQGKGMRAETGKSGQGPWQLWFTGFGECLPYSDNRITLNPHVQDKFGLSTVSIDASFRENEMHMQKDMVSAMGEMLDAAGCQDIKLDGTMSFPGNANHEMGTVRMGRDPATSVLNSYNQMHAVRNVFVTDGSCMTSSSCIGPSLTYMALTARACAYAVQELRKQNL